MKYWLKNRLIFSLIFATALCVFSLFVFAKPNISAHSENLLLTSVYDKSDIDFDIPAPTKEQVNEILNLDFIDNAFGYYYTESSLKIGSKNKKVKMLFSDMLDSLDITMYNESRLISSLDGVNNPLYADYKFMKDNNLNLGDEVEFSGIKFQVGRVYETNTYYGTAIFIPLVGEQKTLIESASKSYSGAYLKSNDLSKTDSYLKSYKPLGRLKDRSNFDTNEEYQTHYNFWNNTSYYNEITSFNSRRDSVILKSEPNFYIAVIISSLVMVGLYIGLSFRNCEKVYFSKKKEKKSVKKYYILSSVVDFILVTLCMVISILLAITMNVEFLPVNYTIGMYISAFIGGLVVLVVDMIYGNVYFKKVVSSKNNKTENIKEGI